MRKGRREMAMYHVATRTKCPRDEPLSLLLLQSQNSSSTGRACDSFRIAIHRRIGPPWIRAETRHVRALSFNVFRIVLGQAALEVKNLPALATCIFDGPKPEMRGRIA